MSLTTDRSMELARIENEIERQISVAAESFDRIGAMLVKIREGELWREARASSFLAYCNERWGLSKQRLHQLIGAYKVLDDIQIPAGVEVKEYHASLLSKIQPEERQEALESAITPEGRVDSKTLKQKVTISSENADASDISPPESTVKNFLPPERGGKSQEVPEIEDSTVPGLVELKANAACLVECVNHLNAVLATLRKLPDLPGLERAHSDRLVIMQDVEFAKGGLMEAMPAGICPRCKGQRCVQCGNHGWVNKKILKELSSGQ